MAIGSFTGFGCGFCMFGSVSQAFNVLGLLFVLLFLVQFTLWHAYHFIPFVLSENRIGLCSKPLQNNKVSIFDDNNSNSNSLDCKDTIFTVVGKELVHNRIGFGLESVDSNSISCDVDKIVVEKDIALITSNDDVAEEKDDFSYDDVYDSDDDDDDDKQFCIEDEVFDVGGLRRLVKIERWNAEVAYSELEKERVAAGSAADEAMAMICRLQGEKSSLEIELNQLKRSAEQKQEYDQEVINSLEWIAADNRALRMQLGLCKEKLKLYLNEAEMEQFEALSMISPGSYDDVPSDDELTGLCEQFCGDSIGILYSKCFDRNIEILAEDGVEILITVLSRNLCSVTDWIEKNLSWWSSNRFCSIFA
ncbi:hypothetical protein ACFE04_000153 [Oxalis oulophora]